MNARLFVPRQRAAGLEQAGEVVGSPPDGGEGAAPPGLTRRTVLAGTGVALAALAGSSAFTVGAAAAGQAAAAAPALPPRVVRQPQPHDIVDDPVAICGIGTGFEATFAARVRDATGRQLSSATIHAGGTGLWGNYHAALPLGAILATAQGTVEVFEYSARDGSEVGKMIVPVVFGRALIEPYHGFGQHTVVRGETLSAIARRYYGAAGPVERRRLYEANRHQLSSPDAIYPGQVLRIPQ